MRAVPRRIIVFVKYLCDCPLLPSNSLGIDGLMWRVPRLGVCCCSLHTVYETLIHKSCLKFPLGDLHKWLKLVMHSWSKLQEGYLYCENDYDMLKLCNSKQTVFRAAGWVLEMLYLFSPYWLLSFRQDCLCVDLENNWVPATPKQCHDVASFVSLAHSFIFLIASSSSKTQSVFFFFFFKREP